MKLFRFPFRSLAVSLAAHWKKMALVVVSSNEWWKIVCLFLRVEKKLRLIHVVTTVMFHVIGSFSLAFFQRVNLQSHFVRTHWTYSIFPWLFPRRVERQFENSIRKETRRSKKTRSLSPHVSSFWLFDQKKRNFENFFYCWPLFLSKKKKKKWILHILQNNHTNS